MIFPLLACDVSPYIQRVPFARPVLIGCVDHPFSPIKVGCENWLLLRLVQCSTHIAPLGVNCIVQPKGMQLAATVYISHREDVSFNTTTTPCTP